MPFWIAQYLKSLGDNFSKVTEASLTANPIYRSAQPSKDRLSLLKSKYNIESIINLREDLTKEEYVECAEAKIELLNYPMSDSKAPEVAQVDEILRVLLTTSKLVPVLVCCKGGRHRTGLIIACYRVRFQVWSKKDAWKEAERFGYYSALGHKPLEDFFFNVFQP